MVIMPLTTPFIYSNVMKFQFFEELTGNEAEAYLERYLRVSAKENINQSVREAKSAGVVADFSVDSIPAFLAWLLESIEPVAKDPEMPESVGLMPTKVWADS